MLIESLIRGRGLRMKENITKTNLNNFLRKNSLIFIELEGGLEKNE